jgi:hypothetical protein
MAKRKGNPEEKHRMKRIILMLPAVLLCLTANSAEE